MAWAFVSTKAQSAGFAPTDQERAYFRYFFRLAGQLYIHQTQVAGRIADDSSFQELVFG